MAEGSDTYKGLAVPLFGDFEIKQRTAATDIVSITAATGATGDFIVCQTVGGGEVFVVGAAGELSSTGDLTVTGGDIVLATSTNYLRFPASIVAAPATALTKGDVFLGFGNTTRPQIGICISTAANTIWYITADTSAFGSTTRNSA